MSNTNTPQKWTDVLPNIQAWAESGNHKKLVSNLSKILSSDDNSNNNNNNNNIPEEARITLTQIYIRSLLKIGSFQTAHEMCLKEEHNSKFISEQAYALYRLKQYEACRKLCQSAMKTDPTNEGLKHTYAQCLYRLHQSKDAFETYQSMTTSTSNNNDEEKEEIATNTLACLQSTFDSLTPPSSNTYNNSSAQDLLQSSKALSSNSYDLGFNLGTYLCMSSTYTSSSLQGEQLLRKALQECQSQLKEEGASDEEIMEETVPIQANLAYALLMNGKHTEADEMLNVVLASTSTSSSQNQNHKSSLPPSLLSARTSAANNLAVRRINTESLFDSLKRLTTAFASLSDGSNSSNNNAAAAGGTGAGGEEKRQLVLTPHMIRFLLYNKAILLFKMGKEDDCRDILKILTNGNVSTSTIQLESIFSSSDHKKKAGKKKNNISSKKSSSLDEHNQLGIQMYAELLEVELLRSKGDVEKANALLQQMKQTYKEGYLSTEIQLYQTQSNILENTEDISAALASLQDIQQSNPDLKSKPAMIATLISMYHDLNQTKEASNLLSSFSPESSSVQSKKALGEYYLKSGMYQDAANVFQEIVEDDDDSCNEEERKECLALLVIALSYLDGDTAEEKLADLGAFEEEDDADADEVVLLDGEQLEQMDIPWMSSGGTSSRRFIQQTRGGDKGQKKKKKNKDSVLRYRAKKRETYLAKLTEEGKYNPEKPTQPDPERWIPKKQRSHYRRRKNRKFGAGTSHQGVAAGMEDKKLDARARAAGEPGYTNANVGPSTAHMSVSSGAGNFKKRGKKR